MQRSKYDHITRSLPIRLRIIYRLYTIVNKCLWAAASRSLYVAKTFALRKLSALFTVISVHPDGDLLVPRMWTHIEHTVLQSLDSVFVMICHRLCMHHQSHSDSSTADLYYINLFGLRDMTQRFRGCLRLTPYHFTYLLIAMMVHTIFSLPAVTFIRWSWHLILNSKAFRYSVK